MTPSQQPSSSLSPLSSFIHYYFWVEAQKPDPAWQLIRRKMTLIEPDLSSLSSFLLLLTLSCRPDLPSQTRPVRFDMIISYLVVLNKVSANIVWLGQTSKSDLIIAYQISSGIISFSLSAHPPARPGSQVAGTNIFTPSREINPALWRVLHYCVRMTFAGFRRRHRRRSR